MKTSKKMLIASAAVVMTACAGSTPFIEGNIKGLEKKKLYLFEYGGIGPVLVDSVKVDKNGNFKFKKRDRTKGEYAIREMAETKGNARDLRRFFVENETVTLNGEMETFWEIEVKGNASDSLYYTFRVAGGANNLDSLMKYVRLYREYPVAPMMVARHMAKNPEFQPYVDMLMDEMPQEIQNTPYGKRARAIVAAERNTRIGMPYMEIEEKDARGNLHKLSDEVKKNKYTLLTFWGSWCGDCRDNIPFITETLNKYGNQGFGVYSVSMDYTYEEWARYLERQKIEKPNWVHVSDMKGWDSEPADRYYVESITTTYFIDENGIIVDKLKKFEEIRNTADSLYGNPKTYLEPKPRKNHDSLMFY